MKIDLKKLLLGAVILFLGAGVCLGLYYLVDVVFNGAFLDWFEDSFVRGGSGINRQALRKWVFAALLANVLLWLLVILIATAVSGRRREKRTLQKVGRWLQRYPEEESKIPPEYGELAALTMGIKADMLQKEQQLREEAGRKNDLIAYLAHDLKTPLTSVIGYLSLMEESPDMPAEQRAKYVHIARDKALRLETLIDEFFEIARFNQHEIVLNRKETDLSYMLVQLTDEFYPLLREHGNRVRLSAEDGLTASVDGDRLARVFNNIIKNAIAYSTPGTEIVITAYRVGAEVTVSFRNQGEAIPPRQLEMIFEKFFRLDNARSAQTGGAGLGLAIAKEIVQLHGGEITAESSDGTTVFTVTLPD